MSYSSSEGLSVTLPNQVVEQIAKKVETNLIKKFQSNPELLTQDNSQEPESAVSVLEDQLTLLSVREVAERLNLSQHTVRSLCHKGDIKYIRPSGRSMMISKKHLMEYISSNTEA